MSNTLIEALSTRKIVAIVLSLLLCQLACFMIGGLVANPPEDSQILLATICEDASTVNNDTTKWFYNRGKGKCKTVNFGTLQENFRETDIVYVFQMPIPRQSQPLHFSRWQQKFIGALQVDIRYSPEMKTKLRSMVTIDARLAYRNRGDPDDDWKLYSQSVVKRHLDCEIEHASYEYMYDCSSIPLFELGSLYHDSYLLNIRLPVETTDWRKHIQDLWLTLINSDAGYVKTVAALKTFFSPCILGALIWFWRRIHISQRTCMLLEKMLLSLGATLCILNFPIVYLSLYFEQPFLSISEDVARQIFYSALFLFWLLLAGEEMMVKVAHLKHYLKTFWYQISGIFLVFICRAVLEIYECGKQIRSPFYSMWTTETKVESNLSLFYQYYGHICFLGIIMLISVLYFLFLSYLLWKAFKNISIVSNDDKIILRYKFLLLATVICSALSIIYLILELVAEAKWKWIEDITFEKSPAFLIGVYGMWNIYVFTLLMLYAPSLDCSEKTADKSIYCKQVDALFWQKQERNADAISKGIDLLVK